MRMAKGLGKGINALFNNVDSNEETVEEIKLKDLRPNRFSSTVFYSQSLFVNRLKDMTL